MEKPIRIAIDGPGGAGKSTIAKAVAAILHIDYIDTGAMYRAVGYKMIQEGIDIKDERLLQEMLNRTEIDFCQGNILLDGKNINDKIRTQEISLMASACSALPAVRKKLVSLQRKMGEAKSVIMDGRDIASNVLPQAEYKFYMTASAEERARRRHEELLEKGQKLTYQQVLEEIEKRDFQDSTRKLNPLKQAEDAILIDTTGLTIEASIQRILQEIKIGG